MATIHAKFTDVYFPIKGVSVGNTAAWWGDVENDGVTSVWQARISLEPHYGDYAYEVADVEGTVTTCDGVKHPITLDPIHEMGMLILDTVNGDDILVVRRGKEFYAYIKELEVDI